MRKKSNSVSSKKNGQPISLHKVPLNQKINLGLASTGANFLNALVTGALMKYYTDIVHMRPQLYGLIFLFYSIWNAINDPLFGYYSDKRPLQVGVGKRLPWMRRTIPLFALGFFLLWWGNPSWNESLIFVYLLACLFIFDSAFTIFVLNQCALATGFTDNPDERASTSMIIIYVNIISAVITLVPPLFLTGGFDQTQIILAFSIIGILGIILMIFSTSKIHEPEILFKSEEPIPLKTALINTFNSKSFLFFVLYSFMMAGVALSSSSTILYYLQWIAGLSQFMAVLPILIGGVVMYALYPFIYRLNKKVGVRNMLMINIIVGIIGCLGLFLIPEGGFWTIVIFYGCVQFASSVHWMFLNTIVGDIADEDELKTGKRREGMFFGMNALIATPSVSIIILVFTTILEITSYNNSEGVINQSTEALMGIRFGIGILPLFFLIVGLIMLLFYPLHGKKYEDLKNKIKILHDKKISEI